MNKLSFLLIALLIPLFSCCSDNDDTLQAVASYAVPFRDCSGKANDTIINTQAGLRNLLEKLKVDKSKDIYSETNGSFSDYSIVFFYCTTWAVVQQLNYDSTSGLAVFLGIRDASATNPYYHFIKTSHKIPDGTVVKVY